MAVRPLRIGTRGSALALYQAGLVRDRLRQAYAELAAGDAVELVPIRTTGDRVQTRPRDANRRVGGERAGLHGELGRPAHHRWDQIGRDALRARYQLHLGAERAHRADLLP